MQCTTISSIIQFALITLHIYRCTIYISVIWLYIDNVFYIMLHYYFMLGKIRTYGHKALEYNLYTDTRNTSNQNITSNTYSALIEWCKSLSTKLAFKILWLWRRAFWSWNFLSTILDFCILTPRSSNQKVIFPEYNVLIGHFSSTSMKLVLTSFITVKP